MPRETLVSQSCRSCALHDFARMTGWTLLLGWWGFISFFINWGFLCFNVLSTLWALTVPGVVAVARHALDEHREYALNLLATRDLDTVVDVLAKTTGAPHVDVIEWLHSLRTSSPA